MAEVTKKQIWIMSGVIGLMTVIWLSVLGKKQPWVWGLDEANLLIHESGHVFFGGFGELLSAMGGTAMQLLTPLTFLAYFAFRKDRVGMTFCLFWVGQNLLNISVYIKDARTQILPLINGGTHDWNIILRNLNLLKLDGFLGGLAAICGHLMMLGAIVYGGYQLFILLKRRAAKPLI